MEKRGKDGLTRSERYRLKDVEAYRKKKREWAKTPDQRKKRTAYMQKWREKNRRKHNQQARESHQRNKHKHIGEQRSRNLKRLYNLTQEQYNEILHQQEGKCLICGTDHSIAPKGLHVDHDHKTGKVRGLLCSRCNGALGWFEKHEIGIQTYLITP